MLSFRKSICIRKNHKKFGHRILRIFWNDKLIYTFYLWRYKLNNKTEKR